jgi:hypothetical protein
MRASRGMGAINPSKMPGGKRMARRDDTDFTQYKKGGRVKKFAEGKAVDLPDLGGDQEPKKLNLDTQLSGESSYSPTNKESGLRVKSGVSGKLSSKYDLGDTQVGLDADISASGKKRGIKTDLENVNANVAHKFDKDTDMAAFANLKKGQGVTSGGASLNRKLDDKTNLSAYLNAARKQGITGGGVNFNKKIGKDSDLSAFANLTPGRGVTEGGVNYNYRFEDGGNVNAAGNYTKPEMRKRIVAQVKAAATQGTGAGQWSARKAQLVAKRYKAAGGGYRD